MSIHSLQAQKMPLIELFWNSVREEAHEAHLIKTLLEIAPLDSPLSLKILLLHSPHRLHTVSKRDMRHNEEHFGET